MSPSWVAQAGPTNTTRRRRRRALLGALGVLAVSNVVTNRVLSRDAALAWNTAATGVLLGLARHARLSAESLGLARERVGSGLRTGALGAAGVAGAFTVLASATATQPVFADDRAATADNRQAARAVGLNIPVGTVLFEELAFRSVLPALVRTELSERGTTALTSVLFGLWHVLPSTEMEQANAVMNGPTVRRGGLDPVRIAVIATAAAGYGLYTTRRWSGHVVAPMLIHATSNILGYVLAWRFGRKGFRQPKTLENASTLQ